MTISFARRIGLHDRRFASGSRRSVATRTASREVGVLLLDHGDHVRVIP